MILDRILSVIYGFNFQPYGEYVPKGFALWGHFFNGSAAALGALLTFSLYNYGKRKKLLIIQIFAIVFILAIGAIIPYLNDFEHLVKNNSEHTLVCYLIFNDVYVFFWGYLMYKVTKSQFGKLLVILILMSIFLFVHFMLYLPQFPEFRWI